MYRDQCTPVSTATATEALTPASLPTVAAVTSCESLGKFVIGDIGGPGSKITSATEIEHQGALFCSFKDTLALTIGFELLLPVTIWTPRYLQVGRGGLCGRLSQHIGAA